jgi:hypothetical protein
VIDPAVNALVRVCAVARNGSAAAAYRRHLLDRVREGGLPALHPLERNTLLADRDALKRIHRLVRGAACDAGAPGSAVPFDG